MKQVQGNLVEVNTLRHGAATGAEPRAVDGRSAEAEYPIEHPLIKQAQRSDAAGALDVFYESVRCRQDGHEGRALTLYQEAMRRDPSLHERAHETLARMLQGSNPKEAGPICYWMGIHSEWLSDWKRAAFCYEQAACAFHEIGYQNRESRARCNLGHVKMRMLDPSAVEEFEKAVALNPRNGIAHINIGTMYYRISEPGDDRFERALDAFADAVVADPIRYGPIVMSRLRSIGYTWQQDLEEITRRVEKKRQCAASENGGSGSRPGTGSRQASEVRASNKTLTFSIISYLLVAAFAFLYIQHTAGFRVLFSEISPGSPRLSGSGFGVTLAVFFGIGACVCSVTALGMAVGDRGAGGSFVSRTMQACDEHKATLGELLFSDYTRRPRTILDALRLQVTTLVRALFKILSVYLSVALLNLAMVVALAALAFVPNMVLDRTMPMLWNATVSLLWFVACYRAQLASHAKARGVDRAGDVQGTCRLAASSSLALAIQHASTKEVTPELIEDILAQESVISAIKNDLARTGQIGYKELWRFGLITPDQDRFDPRPSDLSLRERMKQHREDSNYRASLLEQIAPKQTAVLHSRSYLNFQPDRLTVAGGAASPSHGLLPGWSYGLSTKVSRDEFVRIRDVLIDTDSPFSRNRSPSLTHFLREEGFPLRASYADGDPLTADRGGTIVIDKGELIIIHPRYFVQRRLIDDQGNLVDLGLDEDLGLNPVFAVKMRPSMSQGLLKFTQARGYVPILRYRSVPYVSDFFFPILDTPMSDSGWADLYIDTSGKGRLFIARQKSLAEWYEMMNRLRELLFNELAKKDHHLLGLTQDKAHLNEYMAKKQDILADYFITQDWALP